MSNVKKRDAAKAAIKRYLNASKGDTSNVTLEEISTFQELLKEQWSRFNEAQELVEDACGSELLPLEENERVQTETFYIAAVSNLKRLSATRLGSNQTSNEAASETSRIMPNIKLPMFELPKFSGDHTTWMSFYDSFNAIIHKNESLTGSQKLHYLRCALTDEPLQLIANFKLQDSNYIEAWSLLNARYNVKRVIKDQLFSAIFEVPKAKNDNATEIKNVLDPIIRHVRAFDALLSPIHHWDEWLIHVILHKLAYETRRQWELSRQSATSDSLNDLQEFLEARCRSLEVLRMSSDDQSLSKGTTANKGRKASSHLANTSNRCASDEISVDDADVYTAGTANIATLKCYYCVGNHKIYGCSKFLELPINSRKDAILKIGACSNCLSRAHAVGNCKSATVCKICFLRHHTLLHEVGAPTPSPANIHGGGVAASHHVIPERAHQNTILLATALVTAYDDSGRQYVLRALLDIGSQASFVTEACVQRLHLPRGHENIWITGVGCTTGSTNGRAEIKIQSQHSQQSITICASILPKITGNLPSISFQARDWPQLRDLELADPEYSVPAKIDILIGADEITSVLRPGLIIGEPGTPSLQETIFGWVLFGKVACIPKFNALICSQGDSEMANAIHKAWELETFPKRTFLTLEEEACERIFENSYHRDAEGRFIVSLPFKSQVELGETRELALKSWIHMERRLGKNKIHHEKYNEFLQEMLDQGHMEPAAPTTLPNYYMPHHSVLKENSSTTKIRVVFNASFKSTNGKSLNDALMVGPRLQRDLASLLIGFQTNRYAAIADIAAMYRQIKVSSDHTDFQRILWRKSPTEPIRDYRISRVIYGVASSAHHAIRVMQQLAKEHEKQHPQAAIAIENDFYMDDLLTGASTEANLTKLCKEISAILTKGCFELRKWASNSQSALQHIPCERQEENHLIAEEDDVRALGLRWNSKMDYLYFDIQMEPPPTRFTKRALLSDSCRLFDPIGKLAPITIVPKILFQQVWKQPTQWDDEVSEDITLQWLDHRSDLQNLSTLQIPRWLGTKVEGSRTDLHCFSDASEVAYAAVIYARTQYVDGSINIVLVRSKAKVAPIRMVSIPRLELCAAALAADLVEQLKPSMGPIIGNIYGWSDSMNTLAWLQAHPSKWSVFVANRVAKVQGVIDPANWQYVPNEQNPADCASRGMRASQLLRHQLWWNGPDWLKLNPDAWPKAQVEVSTQSELKHQRRLVNAATATSFISDLMQRYSSFSRLKRITVYCKRPFQNQRRRSVDEPRVGGLPTLAEMQQAEEFWIKISQRESFHEEILSLQKGINIVLNSPLARLNAFIDENGILRVGGRLKHSSLPYSAKHPIILSSKSVLAIILVNDLHKFLLHAGPQMMLATLLRRYWLIGARNLVRKIYRGCLTCLRFSTNPTNQIMADLPETRVTGVRPFFNTGIDMAGPFNMKLSKGRGAKTTKGYIAVFICMATGAMHLEVASDLSAQMFVCALKRFVSRRGLCRKYISDNGTNFVGAERELRSVFERAMLDEVFQRFLADDLVEWQFNPPSSPHMGGYWEAGVKRVKYFVKRAIGEHLLTYEEYYTVLVEIEACINSRPICPLSDDPNGCEVLTPGHFLVAEPLKLLPEPRELAFKGSLYQRWQLISQIRNFFWSRWQREYLVALQRRAKWLRPRMNPKEGDLVVVRDERIPAAKWTVARISKCLPGPDGNVRIVELRTPTGTLTRPLVKVIPIVSDN